MERARGCGPVVWLNRRDGSIPLRRQLFQPMKVCSRQYQQMGPRNGQVKEVTSVKLSASPPTPKKGMMYKLVDLTKNKSGRGR